MFRALLWKEWRELWILPAVVTPLAVVSLFITKIVTHRTMSVLPESSLTMSSPLSPAVWDTGFAIWLLLTALYIPTHLYARESNLNTAAFLQSKPIDRFRLWWFRLFIGLTAMAGIGLILCAIVIIFSLFHRDAVEIYFSIYGMKMVAITTCFSLLLFSLSSFFSALFKKQITAAAGILFALFSIIALLWILSNTDRIIEFPYYYTGTKDQSLFDLLVRYQPARRPDLLVVLLLIFCPGLLLVSLVAFAKDSMPRQSRLRIAATYAPLLIVVLSTVLLGLSRLSAAVEKPYWKQSDSFDMTDISLDGTRILLQGGGGFWLNRPFRAGRPMERENARLIFINLPDRRIDAIETDRMYTRRYSRYPSFSSIKGGKTMLLGHRPLQWNRILPEKIVLFNFESAEKTNLITGRWFSPSLNKRDVFAGWSNDGNYIALIYRSSKERKQDGYIAITDSSGKRIGKYKLPFSEKTDTFLAGWDYSSRLYFWQKNAGSPPRSIVWRVSPDNMVPEEVPGIPFDNFFVTDMSPDGRWVTLWGKSAPQAAPKLHLYDVSSEDLYSLQGNVENHKWSPDGRTLAYTVSVPAPENIAIKRYTRFSKMMLYDVESETDLTIATEPLTNLGLVGWSPSGKYLLFRHESLKEEIDDKGNRYLNGASNSKPYVLSAETRQITEIPAMVEMPGILSGSWWGFVAWIANDRLVWRDDNKLIATDFDGSNPEELFRIEKGKYYLYGEEQS